MAKAYYFGCVGGAGHYLFEANGGPPFSSGSRTMDWTRFCDGGLLKDTDPKEIEGKATWSYLNGYSIISFWDRSVDKRGGCCSSFLVPGLLSFSLVLQTAKEVFPTIFERFKFEIVKAKEDVQQLSFIQAVEDFRFILAATRSVHGRDFIRGQQYGLVLDALDAGANKLLGTDMDERTHPKKKGDGDAEKA